MKRILHFGVLAIMLLARQGWTLGGEQAGSLVIIGGGLRFDEQQVWKRFVALAGGPGTKVAVFPTASDNPLRYGNRVTEILSQYGADPFLVPLAWEKIEHDPRKVAADPQWVDEVKRAKGVFFMGGVQSRITGACFDDNGEPTPIFQAVQEVYRQGGVIAGTSAGAAVMSRLMFRSPGSVLAVMQKGVQPGKDIDRGLGFMPPDWFIDQHALVRGRFARSLVAMRAGGFKYGIGVDENTALVVSPGTKAEVLGHRGAVLLDVSEAQSDPLIPVFNLKNVKLSYLDSGDAINLDTLALTPSPEKQTDEHIDPNSESYRPPYNDAIVSNDVLGNMAMPDLMRRLINNKTPEAIGLAFDGAAAREKSVQGFEFRFYRAEDSKAWFTEHNGAESYTIANIRLDIRPVEVSGPLYR